MTAETAPAPTALETLGVIALRKEARAKLGEGSWISTANKAELLEAITTGQVPARFVSMTSAPAETRAAAMAKALGEMMGGAGVGAGITEARVLAIAREEDSKAYNEDVAPKIATLSDAANESRLKVSGLERRIVTQAAILAEADKKAGLAQNSVELLAERFAKIEGRGVSGGSSAVDARLSMYDQRIAKLEARPAGAGGAGIDAEAMVGRVVQVMGEEFGKRKSEFSGLVKAEIDATFDKRAGAFAQDIMVQLAKKMVKEIVIKTPATGAKRSIGVQHKQFPNLLRKVSAKLHVFLAGPAGSGKTKAAEGVAEALEIPFYPLSVGPQTTMSNLFGYMDANGHYHGTVFRTAFEKGGLFLLDEMDAGNSGVLVALNAALGNGYCSFPDGVVKVHPDFRVVACANTWGHGADRQYVGRNALDEATLNRFVKINWEYDEALELAISGNDKWARRVQAIRAAAFVLKQRVMVTPRASIFGSRLLEAGDSWQEAEEATIWSGVDLAIKDKILAKVPALEPEVKVKMAKVMVEVDED